MTQRPVTGSDAYVAATRINEARSDLTFADSLVLTRLVLEHDGGPVPIRGKRAFTDAATARRLARLELGDLHEDYGTAAGTRTSTTWVLSASEHGRSIVRDSIRGPQS